MEHLTEDDCREIISHSVTEYVKKRIPIRAIQLGFAFSVSSKEGKVSGRPGDWLMCGVRGEFYVCDREIFEETYERTEGLHPLRHEESEENKRRA